MPEKRAPWRVVVVGSSHNDIGWAGTPSEIAEHREHRIIDGVLDLLSTDPSYSYAVEASLYADEYLERNPQRADFVRDLVDSGRLEWGGTYVQPYEGMYSGEALLRQVEYGRRSIGEHWGITSRGAWNVDVQGRTRNLAQAYKTAGIDYLVVSRCKPGLYWWEAQDGSRLLVLSLMQGHYGYPFLNSKVLHSSPLEAESSGDGDFEIAGAAQKLKELTEKFDDFFAQTGLPRVMLVCVTADYTVPSGALSDFIRTWNSNSASIAGEFGIDAKLEFGTAESYIGILEDSGALDAVPVIRGEMPNPWLYIHGPGHHKTIDAIRNGQAALLTAEQLQAVANPAGVPAVSRAVIDEAWRNHLYTDHGFGGLHGVGTDEIFRYKAESALHTGTKAIEESLISLAAEAGVAGNQVLVYNALSTPRSDWVEVEIELTSPLTDPTVSLTTPDGLTVIGHVLRSQSPVSVRTGIARIGFVAPEVPANASLVLTLVETVQSKPSVVPPQVQEQMDTSVGDIPWSNEHYYLVISRGGIPTITDAATDTRVVDGRRYLLGEVIATDSPGIDVGQHEHDGVWDYMAAEPYQPKLTGFERTGNRGTDPQVVFRSVEALRVVSETELSGATVRNTYTFYRDLSWFDLQVDVVGWSGEHGRELRVCFPIAGTDPRVSYEVPFGDVTVGEDEIDGFSHIRPREVQNWIQAVGDRGSLTVSGSVAVYDWVDLDETSSDTVIQAILLATKRSCHPQGNWYDQAGDHTAYFRIDATSSGGHARTQLGLARSTPLRARRGSGAPTAGEPRTPAGLPAWLIPEAAGLQITSIKPLEDGFLVRYWDHNGTAAVVDVSARPASVELWLSDPFGDGRTAITGDHISVPPHGHISVVVLATPDSKE